jgi:hypothetical protein
LSVFYHGTGVEHETAIRRHGLREGPTSRAQGSLSLRYPGVYLTPSRDIACDYASYRAYIASGQRLEEARRACLADEISAAELERALATFHAEQRGSLEGLLLAIELPAGSAFMMDYEDLWGFCCNVPVIPADFITGFERVPFRSESLKAFRRSNGTRPIPDDQLRGRFVGRRFVLDAEAA